MLIKKLFPLVACSVLLTACCTSQDSHSVVGTVEDASMNTVVVTTAAQNRMVFSTMDADRSGLKGLLLGDSVRIQYVGEYKEGMAAEKISTVNKTAR